MTLLACLAEIRRVKWNKLTGYLIFRRFLSSFANRENLSLSLVPKYSFINIVALIFSSPFFLYFLIPSLKAVKNDGGVYWCEAKNELGVVRSRNATLQVAGKFTTTSMLIKYFWRNSHLKLSLLPPSWRMYKYLYVSEKAKGRKESISVLLINFIKHIHFEC